MNNNRRKNNTNRNSSNSNSFSKQFPEVAKMSAKVGKNFMTLANNKYFLYVMLFLGISTVLGFLSVRNFNAVILFVVVAFAMRYFTKNMGIIMLVAVILSNIISVKSTIEGMASKKDKKEKANGKKTNGEKANGKKANGENANGEKDNSEKANGSDSDSNSDKKGKMTKMNDDDATSKLAKKLASVGINDDDDKKESMAPIDYEMGDDVDEDDEDMIDIKSTQQAAYENLNKIIGDKGFAKMTQDTEKLMSQQQNLAKAMESIGPLVQNAEKMMQGLNLDKFSGMLDKLNGMMGAQGQVKGASQ